VNAWVHRLAGGPKAPAVASDTAVPRGGHARQENTGRQWRGAHPKGPSSHDSAVAAAGEGVERRMSGGPIGAEKSNQERPSGPEGQWRTGDEVGDAQGRERANRRHNGAKGMHQVHLMTFSARLESQAHEGAK